ncbi:MAG: rhomboid family intramembrane serine protease [Lentimonas sp.]
MLYDRPYMRQASGLARNHKSVVVLLLFTTIGVFVLQNVLNAFLPGYGGRNYFMGEWFALSGEHFKQLKVWTVLSYSMLHSTNGLFHIIGNMLGLFFIGRILEPILGKSRFLALYFGGALVGGLIFLLFHHSGANTVVGASGAVLALVAFFCLLRPDQPITLLLFFVLPVAVKPKWVFWGTLGFSIFGLLFTELPAIRDPQNSQSMVSHSAHLGGMLAGVLFFRFVYNGSNNFFGNHGRAPSIEMPAWLKKKKKVEPQITYQVNRSNRDNLQNEVDRILDKINTSGFGSLTEDEKKTLEEAKEILSK